MLCSVLFILFYKLKLKTHIPKCLNAADGATYFLVLRLYYGVHGYIYHIAHNCTVIIETTLGLGVENRVSQIFVQSFFFFHLDMFLYCYTACGQIG